MNTGNSAIADPPIKQAESFLYVVIRSGERCIKDSKGEERCAEQTALYGSFSDEESAKAYQDKIEKDDPLSSVEGSRWGSCATYVVKVPYYG